MIRKKQKDEKDKVKVKNTISKKAEDKAEEEAVGSTTPQAKSQVVDSVALKTSLNDKKLHKFDPTKYAQSQVMLQDSLEKIFEDKDFDEEFVNSFIEIDAEVELLKILQEILNTLDSTRMAAFIELLDRSLQNTDSGDLAQKGIDGFLKFLKLHVDANEAMKEELLDFFEEATSREQSPYVNHEFIHHDLIVETLPLGCTDV